MLIIQKNIQLIKCVKYSFSFLNIQTFKIESHGQVLSDTSGLVIA